MLTNPYAVAVPRNLNLQSLELVVRGVLRNHQFTKTKKLVLDFGQLGFVEPDGMVGLANLIGYLRSAGYTVAFMNHDRDTRANHYLDDAGFFKVFTYDQIFQSSAVRSTTVPFRHFTNQDYISYVYMRLEPWIGNEIHVSIETLSTIRACLEEVFHNIEYHSGTGEGFTVSQHFPASNMLKIAISDYGWGIPKRVRSIPALEGLSDWQTIQKACEQGFSTYTAGVKNRGAGLDLLINYVVRRNGGSVEIRSWTGQYKVWHDGTRMRYSGSDHSWFYPGTLVHVCLRTDTLEPPTDDVAPEVFTWDD